MKKRIDNLSEPRKVYPLRMSFDIWLQLNKNATDRGVSINFLINTYIKKALEVK